MHAAAAYIACFEMRLSGFHNGGPLRAPLVVHLAMPSPMTSLTLTCRFEEDLALAKDIGSNAFRFSLEWSRVEPQRGQIDSLAIMRYHDIIDCIRR